MLELPGIARPTNAEALWTPIPAKIRGAGSRMCGHRNLEIDALKPTPERWCWSNGVIFRDGSHKRQPVVLCFAHRHDAGFTLEDDVALDAWSPISPAVP